MRPGVWMTPGWIPILQPAGLMIPGQLGPTRRDLDWLWRAWWTYSTSEAVIRNASITVTKGSGTHPDLILLGDALSDGNNKANLVLNGLDDGVRGEGRWNIKNGRVRFRLPNCLIPKVQYCYGLRTLSKIRYITSLTEPNTGRPK